ncbi:MAG: GTP-binding protein [Bacteroidales bacterium]|jgi:G3E family GTPase
MSDKKPGIVLISGFLGSGKTSLLKKILSQYSQNYKIAVVQNEFSDSSVDSSDISSNTWKFELLDINKGSIFCICLFADFREKLEKLVIEKKPDIIIIEATGLADPISVGVLLNKSEHFYLKQVITVIDSHNFCKLRNVLKCIDNQIRVADIVIINKIDKVSQEEFDFVSKEITVINPNAIKIPARYSVVENILDIDFVNNNPISVNKKSSLSTPMREIYSDIFRTTKRIDLEKFNQMMGSIPEDIIRLKGFIRCTDGNNYLVQYVHGETVIVKYGEITCTELSYTGFKTFDINF